MPFVYLFVRTDYNDESQAIPTMKLFQPGTIRFARVEIATRGNK
jgi:hypothetical protein